MAFQDFDLISERRKNERKQKLKKRIMIGVVVGILILTGAVAAAYVFVYKPSQDKSDNKNNKSNNKGNKASGGDQPGSKDQKLVQAQKAIKTICSSTDYKETCESGLEKAIRANPPSPSTSFQPKEFLKTAISAASNELDNAITQTSKVIKVDTASKEQKAAFDVCKQVLEDAKDDFNNSRNVAIGDKDHLSATPDLDNWLSAVITYQQTCIDATPEGESRNGMEKALKTTKELTSNALAIVSHFSSILSMNKGGASNSRRLLSQDGVGDEDLPSWMTHDQRRMLKADNSKLVPNVTVAKDGSGNFTTISEALGKLPEKYQGRYVIYVKEGVYQENVIVSKKMVNITMYGDGSQKSVITGNKNYVDGVPTFQTATFAAIGEGFIAQSIGFRNTAGPEKHQAVALRVQSDRSIFLNCRMEGYQDTLYAQTHRQFYRGCYILGTVDFIFGDAAAVFQSCDIVIRKPMDNQQNIVTAQGRVDKRQTTGIVLQKCKISADSSLEPQKSKIKSYLGRPWKEYSRTIVMESDIGDVIHPDGWLPWSGDFALKTLYYAEYNNVGAGSDVKARVKWPGYQTNFKKEEAQKYTVGPFLLGESWLKDADVPVRFGFYN